MKHVEMRFWMLFLLLYGITFVNAQSNLKPKLENGTPINRNGAKVDNSLLMYGSSMLNDPTVCYAFDDNGNHLMSMTRSDGTQTDLGESNVSTVEAVVMGWNGDTLYGANANTFGYFDNFTPTFVNIGSFGSGFGASGTKTMSDVDGLAIDPTTGIFYGAHRDGDGGAPADLLFKFDHTTGQIIQNGFGNDEYVLIDPTTFNSVTYDDIDDIAIDPVDGQMYGIANEGGGVNLLVRIDKTNGNTTLVARLTISDGSTIVNMPDSEGLSFYNDGTMYLTTGTNPSRLYQINKSNAVGTLVGTFTVGSDYEGVACLTGGIVTANDDSSIGNVEGSIVMINILSNDLVNNNSSTPSPSEVMVDLNPSSPGNQSTLVVSGEGTWAYNSSTGVVTFTPLAGFTGDPTPIPYVLTEIDTGETDPATITIDYINCEANDNTNTIIGTIYNDADRDQVHDVSESGFSNASVQLFEDFNNDGNPDGTAIQTTSPNTNGDYQFNIDGLVYSTPGTYSQRIENSCNDAKDGKEDEDELKLGKDEVIGVKFDGIAIPSNATINSAFLYFTASENKDEAGSTVNIHAHDVANPDNFCTNNDTDGRTRTTNNSSWSLPNLWNQNQEYQSADISNVVSELIGSHSYPSPNGGSMVFLMVPTGSKNKKVHAVDGDAARAPRLVINYTTPGNGPYRYIVSIDQSSLPDNAELTTDNIETAVFTSDGTIDCNNDFGVVLKYDISGSVYDDGNAGTVNGTGLGNPDATTLYANLVDTNGDIVASVPVNSNGTYTIDGIYPGTYDVEISTVQGVIGNQAPDPTLPTGWNNTNEGQGPNASGDGNANGSQSITISSSDLSNIDFGINDAPVASNVTATSQVNPGGTTTVTAGAPSVTDLEDGTPTTITIKSLPTDGSVLYYNGVAVTADQTITNFNPALLTIDPADGAVSPQYTYTTTDAAGVESNVATVTQPFTTVNVSGTVFDDGDAGTVNGSTLSNNVGAPLYAHLVDGSGNVVGVSTVDATDGTYDFTGVTPGDYQVVLST
ncbi:MAG: hypothetical protein HKN68_10670, partial [Saprospiraceae bacterium]|nr:hypothetical protein [Saprospiraceae bacterium]